MFEDFLSSGGPYGIMVGTDLVAQKHISLVVILVKIADEWKTSHGGTLPSTREGKKNSRNFSKPGWLQWMKTSIKKLLMPPLIEESIKI
ncbi:NEDD8-activating enzyme E1 regulatory subunit-like protein [Gossypium australe]|uniref:NEDD8-activating enzyme E1 regulatory subunit-like protein n=1 Tax=Gossypium australe TaxID=47621 RepID=A0A5B6UEV9_9ROSI|nr:NEDD8-activating enzyme E1 regulatory subunit-like protein [Gossypium australe]